MFLNIASPHTIYIRTLDQKRLPPVNGMNNVAKPMMNGASSSSIDANGGIASAQLFAQSNGQIVELCNDRLAIKSVWEYFLEKNTNA